MHNLEDLVELAQRVPKGLQRDLNDTELEQLLRVFPRYDGYSAADVRQGRAELNKRLRQTA